MNAHYELLFMNFSWIFKLFSFQIVFHAAFYLKIVACDNFLGHNQEFVILHHKDHGAPILDDKTHIWSQLFLTITS